MFPIRDHNPSKGTPFVTWALITLNVVVFGLTVPWGGHPGTLWEYWALYPAAVTHGVYLHGLVTHMFLHAGLLHLAGNMLFLWIFGDNLEEHLGHLGFGAFYLLGGLAAAFAQIAADPGSGVPMVGASGAIAAVMGGYLLLFPRARVDVLFIFIIFFRIFPVPAWLVLGVWLGIQVLNGSTAGITDGVAYWAHAGGFGAGVLMTIPVWLKHGGTAYWGRTHGRPSHPGKEYTRTNIPVVRRRR
ncbi:rhomboid family intramembrane serine protease [Phaeovulum sp.]|uniref:rhomboid family intramembrane serine protease n=1 Tax=Phaeovulum sp. TaxID=2934796 RepID=UPI0039E301B2